MADVVVERRNLDNLEKGMKEIENRIVAQSEKIAQVGSDVQVVQKELTRLKQDFESLINEQRRTAAIQQATTELVRIRQDLEQNFGNYRIVRETMLGVLQATDSALVRETTIARVSEELMLSTPKYWLAPVLVAVSAWISNDRDLAERAIKEAVRRDEERTALTMALICRRNKRVDTCYEWLSIYFSKQKAYNFSPANLKIVDAYINNVFGPDEKHLCDEYMNRWINEIRGNSSNFEEEQERVWSEFCNRNTVDIDADFPDMKKHVKEYDQIKGYVSRISSVDGIENKFKKIHDAYVDEDTLKGDVDQHLVELISCYDQEEEQLRREERLQQAIKDNDGSKEAAISQLAQEDNAVYKKSLNLIEQMTRVITDGVDCRPSEKKTAVSFLGGYIKKGFKSYITEKRELFPSEITIEMDGWQGTTHYDENRMSDRYCEQELLSAYTVMLANERKARIEAASKDKSKMYLTLGIIFSVLAVVGIFINPLVLIAFGIGAVSCFINIGVSKKKTAEEIERINNEYNSKIESGRASIMRIIEQWDTARNKVISFQDKPVRDFIA